MATVRHLSNGSTLRVVFLLLLMMTRIRAWHGTSNAKFHCWKLSASANDPIPFSTCPGVDIDWVVAPPDEIKAEAEFNVTYSLQVTDAFYTWAVSNNLFANAGTTGGYSNATQAKNWCQNTQCPADYTSADQTNCCVHHVNVHSCPMAQTSIVTNGLCGPWIPANGSIFTHSKVMVGPITTGQWTSVVNGGLYEVGQTSMIAHFKIAGLHVAIEQKVKVLPKTVCGDGVCEEQDGEESCGTCPSDCGRCPLQDFHIALIVVTILLVILAILSVFGYFQYQRRKLLWDESWIVAAEGHCGVGDGGEFGSRLLGSRADVSSMSSNNLATEAIKRQIFATLAYVDGRQMAVRKVNNSHFHLTKAIRIEVRDVRSLDHPNLCRFLGGCIDPGKVCVLYEYCPKGSLMDVLQNDAIPLSWAFRFSLVTDVARGMSFLHKNKLVHGSLKANNCVIDDRWTCKVTDFGLNEYRKENTDSNPDLAEEKNRKETRSRVYRAPETNSKSLPFQPASDVYSFAIILVEVAMRDDAYGDEDSATLPEGWKPPLPRYSQDTSTVDADYVCPSPHQYTKLILDCWADKMEDRPTFDAVKKTLQRINPNKLSPVDTMMAIMEKYSKHLESVVNERTQQLMEEKQRTDMLLYSMLPRQVAELLKTGGQVEAVQFECCTIYFSDIVGFTTLSGNSTAMQVVQLLNKLYTTFDSIIERYDVYKVETIGDAYMVVSGVPSITKEHARHVAMMSLDMVAASQTFQIPHMPQEPLRIRVGLHSGPVCAGVVGIKMPRYCLFGDTVNTASRMESNGEAYKIHISNTTYDELQKFGGFVCESRGSIAVKGKGEMFTWWLQSREESPSKKKNHFSDNTLPPSKEGGNKDKEPNVDTVIQEILQTSLCDLDLDTLLQ